MSEIEIKLHNPLSKEDWDKIRDLNMENIPSVTFQTPNGKQVKYVKVVHCKDCKWLDTDWVPQNHNCYYCPKIDNFPEDDWYCADGERKG